MAADGVAAGKALVGVGVGVGGGGCGRLLRKLMPLLSSANALMSAKTPGAAPIAAIEPAMDVDEVALPAATPPGPPPSGWCVAATTAACATVTAAALPGAAAAAVDTAGGGTGAEGPPPPASGPLVLVVNATDGSVVAVVVSDAVGDEALTPAAGVTVASSATGAVVAWVTVTGAGFCAGKPAGVAVVTSPPLPLLPAAAVAAVADVAVATAFSNGEGATPTRPGTVRPDRDLSAVAMASIGCTFAVRRVENRAAAVVKLEGAMVAGGGAVLLVSPFWDGAAGTVGNVGVGGGAAVAAVAAVAAASSSAVRSWRQNASGFAGSGRGGSLR